MEPESNGPALTTAPTKYVTIPAEMAHILFDCYYGGGPRHQDRGARSVAPPPTASPESTPEIPAKPGANIPRVPKLWEPQGFAARVQKEAEGGSADKQE